jgi:hypothetical protein
MPAKLDVFRCEGDSSSPSAVECKMQEPLRRLRMQRAL